MSAYPALDAALRAFAARPSVLVALDFDGVLAPIVDDPAAARALPASRACERGSLSVAVTSKAKRAAAIKRVRLLVNGRVAATVTDPRAGRLLKARLVRESGADVRVEVTLDKARKPLRAGATYVPCG